MNEFQKEPYQTETMRHVTKIDVTLTIHSIFMCPFGLWFAYSLNFGCLVSYILVHNIFNHQALG